MNLPDPKQIPTQMKEGSRTLRNRREVWGAMNRAIPSHRSAWQAAPCRHQIPCTCHRLPGSVWEGPIFLRSSGCGRYSYTQWPTCQFQPSGLQQREACLVTMARVARWYTLLPLLPWTFSIDHNLWTKTYWVFIDTVPCTQVIQIDNICFKGAFRCCKLCYELELKLLKHNEDPLPTALIQIMFLLLSEDVSLQSLLLLLEWIFVLKAKILRFFVTKICHDSAKCCKQIGLSAAAGFQVCAFIAHHLKWDITILLLTVHPFLLIICNLLIVLITFFLFVISKHFNIGRLVMSQDTDYRYLLPNIW